ncbi:unnamed protein product [Cyclocybe aegerita]|uniref:Uncharacterized protein n=1 Tax=Cyclocybe aegerita TaxID=1973307 RepID=A0A8S0WPW6_CYCAE|nr:unnamed protein product [Cyclocybe aegerita]
MDFTGFSTLQEFSIDGTNPLSPPVSSGATTTTDHVKWQGSQTACQALNQLIQSSANEDGVGKSRGWHRQSSFDQIPGFSLLSTNETGSSSGSSSQASVSNSTKPSLSRSSRPSISRARLSDTRTRGPPDQTNVDASPSGLPFFAKTSPAQFLDMLKGVSARLDENVEAHRKDVVGQTSKAVKKRARGASLGVSSEHLVGKTKSRRMDGLRVAGQRSVVDKGKARAVSASALTWETPSTCSNTSSHLDGVSSLGRNHDDSIMDVDDKPRSIAPPSFGPPPATLSRPSCSTSLPKTPSQAEMPPPAMPTKHPSVAPTTAQSSMNYQRHPPTVDVKPRKPDPIPKLHPLLQQQAAQLKTSIPASSAQSNSTSFNGQSTARNAATRHVSVVEQRPSPKVDPRPQVHPAAPATTIPVPFASTPSNRPPVLGMRRTHTYPSRPGASGVSKQFFGNNANNAPLPTRQKGFKPPLLSNSQPQLQPQGQTTINSRPQPQYPARNGNVNVKVEASSNASRSFSGSSTSSGSQNSAKSASSSTSHSRSGSGSGCNTSVDSMPSSTPAEVPAFDTDPDSSFGDMSFDMDALEETMKMYD